MMLETYAADVRSDPARFVVAPGHDLPEIEAVLLQTHAYEIVLKRGDAADLVSGNA